VLAGQRFGLEAKERGGYPERLDRDEQLDPQQVPPFILSRAFNSGFSLDLMVKDLKTAVEIAHATGSPAPLASACLEAWSEAQASLGPGADHTAVVRYWEKLAGTELKKSDQLCRSRRTSHRSF
jgi:3-hydroxyisobutyrate dehydrogenase